MESTLKSENIISEVSSGVILSISSLAVGAISYGNLWWTIGLSLMFPVLLFRTETRAYAFFVALLYHMAPPDRLLSPPGISLVAKSSLAPGFGL